MDEIPMLFPISPTDFWKQFKIVATEIIDQRLGLQSTQHSENIHDQSLLKLDEVCAIFKVSRTTIYGWMKQGRIKSFKVRSRRYFLRAEIETMIK